MGFLFCLSLLPFTSAWMGENIPEKIPLMLYSINLAVCAVAFYFLQMCVLPQYKTTSKLIDAVKKQKTKGMISLGIYIAAAVVSFIMPWLSIIIIIIPAILWVIPDKNIEAAFVEEHKE